MQEPNAPADTGKAEPAMPPWPTLAAQIFPEQGLTVDTPEGMHVKERDTNGWSVSADETRGVALYVKQSLERRSVTPSACEAQASGTLSVLREARSRWMDEGEFRKGELYGKWKSATLPDGVGLWALHAALVGRCVSAVWRVRPSENAAFWLTLGREVILPSVRRSEIGERVLPGP